MLLSCMALLLLRVLLPCFPTLVRVVPANHSPHPTAQSLYSQLRCSSSRQPSQTTTRPRNVPSQPPGLPEGWDQCTLAVFLEVARTGSVLSWWVT